MRRGEPLTDADRDGWLAALSELAARLSETGQPALIACSALKHAYRERLREAGDDVRFVYLKGSYELIRTRLESRRSTSSNRRCSTASSRRWRSQATRRRWISSSRLRRSSSKSARRWASEVSL